MRTKDRAMMVLRPAMAILAGVATKWAEFVGAREVDVVDRMIAISHQYRSAPNSCT